MTIKPIDLQTNLAKLVDVGKGEQARSGAIAEQQHGLEKESQEKSRLVNSKLDEAKKAEKTSIKDEQEKERQRRERRKNKSETMQKKHQTEKIEDDRMGRIIDVLK